MANETVIIGCKLPSGITLEVGYSTTTKPDIAGKITTMVVRDEDKYTRIVLKGWHHHADALRKEAARLGQPLMLPAGAYSDKPFLNRGVNKAAWEEWKKQHPRSWLLRNKILFEATNEADATVKQLDGAKTPTMLAPLERPKATDDRPNAIRTADFARGRANAEGEE